jgi:predicted O-linked N-acetylglucosamine transferase (SPINDLY family)
MDYLLADSTLVSESERALLSERVVNLPNFLGYWTPEPLPQPGPLPALTQGHITFGSFSRLEKITYPTIASWASILRKLPTANLVLKDRALADTSQRKRLKDAFAAEGVSAGRLKLLVGSDRASHFAAYQKIDIALDPFPHGGGMTTLDALWMGIPVVTWAGQTISSRLAAASLTASGLTDFIANAPETYVDLAVAKATNVEALSRLRTNLRTQIAATEFGDCARYSRAVEAAYREMWQRWCSAHASHAHSEESQASSEELGSG